MARRATTPARGYGLLAVDLDGTLLDASGRPHEVDVAAIAELRRRGVVVSICTGRLYSGTRDVAQQLDIRGPVACADGSHIVRVGDHTTLVHHGLGGSGAKRLRTLLAKHELTLFLFAGDTIVCDDAGAEWIDFVRVWSTDVRKVARVLDAEAWGDGDGLTALVAVGGEDAVRAAADAMQRDLARVVQVAAFPVRRVERAWGLVARAALGTKGTALEWLAKHHGLALADCVCVGDWRNDVPMFEVAGRSFAMGHAPDEVKASATDVLERTATDGGGIAEAIAKAFSGASA